MERMLLLLFFTIVGIVLLQYLQKKKEEEYKKKLTQISEFSFQKFARFYGETVLPDKDFDNKMSKICELVLKDKETDVNKIAELSNCSYDECILKIKYLKNKRRIGDYHLDTINGTIKPCTKRDKALIKKYTPFIYYNHYQIDEIARKLPHATMSNIKLIEQQVMNELDYLDKKNLINGLNIDKVDRKIIYYSVEKHKKENDYITLNCKNCGAICDVPRRGKARCEYCETIVEDVQEN